MTGTKQIDIIKENLDTINNVLVSKGYEPFQNAEEAEKWGCYIRKSNNSMFDSVIAYCDPETSDDFEICTVSGYTGK